MGLGREWSRTGASSCDADHGPRRWTDRLGGLELAVGGTTPAGTVRRGPAAGVPSTEALGHVLHRRARVLHAGEALVGAVPAVVPPGGRAGARRPALQVPATRERVAVGAYASGHAPQTRTRVLRARSRASMAKGARAPMGRRQEAHRGRPS